MYKKSTTILIIVTTMLIGCAGLSRTNNMKAYIPGTYARLVRNEFSIGRDTLIISELSKLGNSYRIIHKTAFQRVEQGRTSKVERKKEVWNAVYNEQEKLLHETVKGKLLSFNPEGSSLYVGSSEYKKISE